jgi:hypothetical protein
LLLTPECISRPSCGVVSDATCERFDLEAMIERNNGACSASTLIGRTNGV